MGLVDAINSTKQGIEALQPKIEYSLGNFYIAQMNIGTPPYSALLLLDTGTDNTWVQAAECAICFPLKYEGFDYRKSETYYAAALLLPIDVTVFQLRADRTNGFVIDSGSGATFLVPKAYNVTRRSPADRAGFCPGDVVNEFDGKPVESIEEHPPPSRPPQSIPLGKHAAPLPKLKPFHWDKVKAAPNQPMVWDMLPHSFKLDEEMIESLFGDNLKNSMKSDEEKKKTPPSKYVFEPKRLQNISILSKALNVTVEEVCKALIQGKGLGLQQLEALVKMVPTKEEEAKLSSYEGDINELESVEKFFKEILEIPFAFLRVEAMLYRETFEDEVVQFKKSFSMLEEACKELRSSRLFLKLLEAVLKTGNRMNVGTSRGGARAFKLDTLLKLAHVKGTDGKTTLLHFVVQEILLSEGIRASDSIMGVEQSEEDYKRMGLDRVSGLSTELLGKNPNPLNVYV
nr:formin-like protein 11 [Quercus suber]